MKRRSIRRLASMPVSATTTSWRRSAAVTGLPKESIGALLVGFLRKDVALGMLIPLSLNFKQLVIASVVLTMYFPCVASFVVLIKELGILDMLKATVIMLIAVLLVGGALNLLL